MTCIFGDRDQWASIKHIAPAKFNWHATNEHRFGLTIVQNESVIQQAERGKAFVKDTDPKIVTLALSQKYPRDYIFLPKGEKWVVPAGAYKRCGGPI